MNLIREVLVLRRRAPELSEPWVAAGLVVLGPEGAVIARFTRADLAVLVAKVHNTWLALSNQWLLALRQVQDRRYMTATEREDADNA